LQRVFSSSYQTQRLPDIQGYSNKIVVNTSFPSSLLFLYDPEEEFPIEDLWRIVLSMKSACEEAGVLLVTGDTKVVNKGKGDKAFINTSGIGIVEKDVQISSEMR
jgi:hydrogenase expression/formation protein HypE